MGDEIFLVKEIKDVEEFGCKDSCLYSKVGDNSGSVFCFQANGEFEVRCGGKRFSASNQHVNSVHSEHLIFLVETF